MKKTLILIAMLLLVQARMLSAPTAPSPGDSMLIILTDDADNVTTWLTMRAALDALPAGIRPTYTVMTVASGDADGIYDDLTANGYNLADYCQVWDLRFLGGNNGAAFSGGTYGDTITFGCPTCDSELFQAFLLNGGHLYVQGENEGFYGRNESVMQFITDATGSTVTYPSVVVGTKTWSVFDNSGPDLFGTNYNTLTTLGSNYAGQVILSGIGNGKPLTTGGGYTLDLLWNSAALTAGNGQLFINFDTNSFFENMAGNQAYVQNMYVTQSTCYNFTIDKAVSPPEVCVGEPATFTLCYENTGTRAIPNAQIWDTISTCLSFDGASPAPSGNSGNVYTWNLGSLAPGASACIDINVTAVSGAPCP